MQCFGFREFGAEFSKERLDYDAFNTGMWINVFGSTNNRCLQTLRSFLIFRLVEAIVITAILLWSFVHYAVESMIGCWFTLLAHWVLILECAFFWTGAWTARQADLIAVGDRPVQQTMPRVAKVHWILQDLVIPSTFLLCVFYWPLVVPAEGEVPAAVMFFSHAVNFLVVILDNWLSRQPYYLMRFFYVFILGAVYVLFSLIYYAADGTNCGGSLYIYKSLDWNESDSAATLGTILVFILVPLWNLIFWFLISQVFPGNYREEADAQPPPSPRSAPQPAMMQADLGVC